MIASRSRYSDRQSAGGNPNRDPGALGTSNAAAAGTGAQGFTASGQVFFAVFFAVFIASRRFR